MADIVYNIGKTNILNATIDLVNDSIKVALVTAFTGINTPDGDLSYNTITTNAIEASGTGYTAGGIALTSNAVTQEDGSDLAKFDAADVTWAASTITAAGAVIYHDTPAAAADKKLIALIDFGGNQSSSAANFTIQWNANGIFTLG